MNGSQAKKAALPPRSHPPTWAVVGGSGFVGGALIAHLRRTGANVKQIRAPRLEMAPTSSPENALDCLREIETLVDDLAVQLDSADIVVNAAGLAAPDSPATKALFGANALLPLAVLAASRRVNVSRVIHVSSAAVQGRKSMLDESTITNAFSPYSLSKAVGEAALAIHPIGHKRSETTQLTIVRATSVQGRGRPTTERLRRLAMSPLASVASPGDQPTVVSSISGLVDFLTFVGTYPGDVPSIVLQPWEGLTTEGLILLAGGRRSVTKLPAQLCRAIVSAGYAAGSPVKSLLGPVRRVELMWFGQSQDAAWATSVGYGDKAFAEGVSHPFTLDAE